MKKETNWKPIFRKRIGQFFRYAPWILILLLAAQRVPNWWANFTLEGESIGTIGLPVVEGPSQFTEEKFEKAAVLVFWASWCGPCRLELGRFQDAIRDGEIPADRVLAVSIDQSRAALMAEVKSQGYTFPIFHDVDGSLARRFSVSVTPTQVHVERGGRVRWVSSGASLTGVMRAKSLLTE